MLGAHRFILAGKYDGHTLDLNDLHELSLISDAPGEAADDSRGSNTAHEHVRLLPRLDAPPALADVRPAGNGGAAGAAGVGALAPAPLGAPVAAAAAAVDADADALTDALAAERMGAAPMAMGGGAGFDSSERSSGGEAEEQSLLQPAPAQLRGSGGESPSSSDAAAATRAETADVSSVRSAAMLFPMLPILASGTRLLNTLGLRSVMPQLQVSAPEAAAAPQWQQDAPQAAPLEQQHADAPQAPPPVASAGGTPGGMAAHAAYAHAASCEDPGAAAVVGGGAHRQSAQSLEERDRRRRSLTRELGHPRPNCSSGSDEEPPCKRGGQHEEDDGLDA
jgi:hypothetical protein